MLIVNCMIMEFVYEINIGRVVVILQYLGLSVFVDGFIGNIFMFDFWLYIQDDWMVENYVLVCLFNLGRGNLIEIKLREGQVNVFCVVCFLDEFLGVILYYK